MRPCPHCTLFPVRAQSHAPFDGPARELPSASRGLVARGVSRRPEPRARPGQSASPRHPAASCVPACILVASPPVSSCGLSPPRIVPSLFPSASSAPPPASSLSGAPCTVLLARLPKKRPGERRSALPRPSSPPPPRPLESDTKRPVARAPPRFAASGCFRAPSLRLSGSERTLALIPRPSDPRSAFASGSLRRGGELQGVAPREGCGTRGRVAGPSVRARLPSAKRRRRPRGGS